MLNKVEYVPALTIVGCDTQLLLSNIELKEAYKWYTELTPGIVHAIYKKKFYISTDDTEIEFKFNINGFRQEISIPIDIRTEDKRNEVICYICDDLKYIPCKVVASLEDWFYGKGSANPLYNVVLKDNVTTYEYTLGYTFHISNVMKIHFKDYEIALNFIDYMIDSIISQSDVIIDKNKSCKYDPSFIQTCTGDDFTLVKSPSGLVCLCPYLLDRYGVGVIDHESLRQFIKEAISILPNIVRRDLLDKYIAYDEYGNNTILYYMIT